MSSPFYKIKLDIQHIRRQFHIYCSSGDTPVVRAYLYQDGEKWTPPEDWVAQLGYGENFENSTSLVKVDGTSGYAGDSSSSSEDGDTDYNYFEFQFTSADVGTPNDYFCQVMVQDALDTERYVFGSGTIHVLDSPIGGTPTDLSLTQTLNWDSTDTLGTPPYELSTEIIKCSDCSSSTTTISADDSGKTWVWSGSCDQTFLLPVADSDSEGAVFVIYNQTSYITTVRTQAGQLIDEFDGAGGYPAIYSWQGSVNDNNAPTRVVMKQTSETGYDAVGGKGKWTFLSV